MLLIKFNIIQLFQLIINNWKKNAEPTKTDVVSRHNLSQFLNLACRIEECTVILVFRSIMSHRIVFIQWKGISKNLISEIVLIYSSS